VPRDAALSFYLLSDAEQPLAYARAVAPPRQRREAAEAVARLRDGAFAAAGLDYAGELAGWLGPETGLWVLADQGGEPGGWVLALSSRDNDGARRFLQRFWQTRSLAGTELQISSYRGMGVISGRGALVGRQPIPLATALIDDDLVLLASGRGALEQALDVSQIEALNQAADPLLQRRLDRLGRGMAVLVARPGALQTWLGGDVLPLPGEGLVAVLRPQGRELVLDGWLESGHALEPEQPLPLPAGADGQALLTALQGEVWLRSQGMTDAAVAFTEAMPVWMTAVWAIGVWGAMLGSLLLLFRSRWAFPVFVISLAAYVMSLVYQYVLTDGATGMGESLWIMQTVILFICLFFVWYAQMATKRGILR
jgi:hypothetical protein